MFHMLKPGGKLVFSDITAGATQMTFNSVNAVSELTPAAEYESVMLRTGFTALSREDNSHHLHVNFRRMLDQIESQLDESVPRVKNFADSLRTRLKSNAIDWNFFWATKRPAPKTVYCTARVDREWLEGMAGFQVSWNRADGCLAAAELDRAAGGGRFDGVIVTFKDQPTGRFAPVVATLSSGTEHLRRLDGGVAVANAPEAIAESCSEYVVAMALAANRGLLGKPAPAENAVGPDDEQPPWSYRSNCQGKAIREMRIGVVGMGRIGQLVATKFAQLGCTSICYHSRSEKKDLAAAGLAVARYEPALELLMGTSDVVVVCCNLNESSTKLISAERIKQMGKGSVLISVARAAVVDFEALALALADGSGVVRVVADDAPVTIAGEKATTVPGFTVTSHIASNTESSREEIFLEAFANMARKIT
jgi:phosphoglycerate dehydrogenase-like enzyme